MALVKMTKEQWKIEPRGSKQVIEAIELNLSEAKKSYAKDNHSLAAIAKQLDKVYKSQFENEDIFVPTQSKIVSMKPTIKANNVKRVFIDHGIELKDKDK